MNRFAKRFGTFTAIAASLLLWGCENVDAPTQPGQLEPAPMIVKSTTGDSYIVAMELNPTAGEVSAEIGAAGGELRLGDHTLWVSAGAVDSVTTFTLKRDPEFPLRVKLTASRHGDNDIGSQGFNAEVKLGISYGDALRLPASENAMKILYFRPDGLVEVMASWVFEGDDLVTAVLPHFSIYGLGWGGP